MATRRRQGVSAKEIAVLELLSQRDQLYGLELVRLSDGALKPGTVYVTLERAVRKGLVSSELEAKPPHVPGRARRLYCITERGRGALETVLRLGELLEVPA